MGKEWMIEQILVIAPAYSRAYLVGLSDERLTLLHGEVMQRA